jgi:hypothetical protein
MSDLRNFLLEQAQKPAGRRMWDLSNLPAEPAPKRRETKAQRKERREEWRRAVASLIDRLETWLHEADEDHALTIDRIPITISERRFGTYEVEGLRVRLGIDEFLVKPIGLNVLMAIPGDNLGMTLREGEVKLSGWYRRYSLYRKKTGPDDEWIIADHEADEARILDQPTFEDVVYKLLK